MGVNHTGHAECRYCGAHYTLFTIFNRDMQGLAKAWKRKHERKCKDRTPEQRRKWAKPYVGKDVLESSLIVDMEHEGFLDLGQERNEKINKHNQRLAK